MSGVASAVIAVATAAGGAYSANQAKKSQDKANATNKAISDETNRLNKQMFDESRGSTGHAWLPTYTGDAEQQIWNDLYNTYLAGTFPDQARYNAEQIQASLQPAVSGGTDYLNNLYSGANLEQSRGYYQPLWDARTQNAQAQADAVRQAYARQARQNRATAMQQGFYGGSSVQSAEAQKNTLDAIQQAALAKGTANIANQTEAAQLGLADLQARGQMLNEPFTRAQNLTNYNNLAEQAAYSNYDQLANRLKLFNIGTGRYTYQQAPYVSANLNSGQIYGTAASTLGLLGQQYLMNKQYQNALNTNYNTPYAHGSPASAADWYPAPSSTGDTYTPSSTSTISFGGAK